MSINLLNIAMSATSILGCNQPFTFLKWKENIIDEMGRDVPSFEEPVTLYGSVQPVSNKTKEQLGLNLENNYINIFCSALINSVAEQKQPDRVIWDNRTFEAVETKDWYIQNGWTKNLFVELKELRENGTDTQIQDEEPNI